MHNGEWSEIMSDTIFRLTRDAVYDMWLDELCECCGEEEYAAQKVAETLHISVDAVLNIVMDRLGRGGKDA